MSLLSDTQGSSERVHALMRLVDALGDAAERTRVKACMTAAAPAVTDFEQTLGAARSLDLVEEHEGVLRLSASPCPQTHQAFSDLAHARLVAAGDGAENATMLDCYAYVAHRTDEHDGPHWFQETTRESLADELLTFIKAKRPGSGIFNLTRLPYWLRWMEAVGLATKLPKERALPDVTPRLTREIEASRPRFEGRDVPAREFVDWILERMPYLPGGSRALSLVGPPRAGALSNLLSAALASLQDDGVLKLQAVGDAAGAITLARDPVKGSRSFVSVRLLAPLGAP